MNAGLYRHVAAMKALHNSSEGHERIGHEDQRLAIGRRSKGRDCRFRRIVMELNEMLVVGRQRNIARLGISHCAGIFDGDRAVANDFALDPFRELL